jgi:hypothetical protein
MDTAVLANMIFCGIITLLIGRQKNFRPVGSFVIGALLSVIGIVIIALWPAKAPKVTK